MTDNTTIDKMTQDICKFLDDKLATDIVIVEVGHLTVVADRFIICSGRSNTQVKAIVENVDYEMGKLGIEPLCIEGKDDGRWGVIDYGAIIVHVFYEETRRLYSLEKLWGDGANVTPYAGTQR